MPKAPLHLALAVVALSALAATTAPQPVVPAQAETAARFALHPSDEPQTEHRIVLRSGVEIVGIITDRLDGEIKILAGEKPATIPTRQVAEIEPLAPVAERYAERRALIDEADTAALLLLAEWLRDRGAYRTALREATAAAVSDPLNAEASRLARWLRAQVALIEAAGKRERDGDAAGTTRSPSARFPLLSPEEVNAIRVWEIDLSSNPRVVIPRPVIDQVLEAYAGSSEIPSDPKELERLRKLPPTKFLELMFRLRARDYYGEVRVLDDPPALAGFRETTHRRWLLNGCATSSCHGGSEAGRLRLATVRPNSDQTAYTNFYILESSTLADGTPLINHADPAESPLLHLGLPRTLSNHPHPNVIAPGTRARGWRPVFPRGRDDPRFQDAVGWISGLYQPRPDYGVTYELPEAQETRSPERIGR